MILNKLTEAFAVRAEPGGTDAATDRSGRDRALDGIFGPAPHTGLK